MCKKMIFFAFAGKCGGFTAKGFSSMEVLFSPKQPPKIDESAKPPRPEVHFLRKCRRVLNLASSKKAS